MSSEYVPAALRQLVFNRARGVCEYCRSPVKYAIDPLGVTLLTLQTLISQTPTLRIDAHTEK